MQGIGYLWEHCKGRGETDRNQDFQSNPQTGLTRGVPTLATFSTVRSQDTVKGQEATYVAPDLPWDNCEIRGHALATGAKKTPNQIHKQNATLSSLSSCLPVETAEAGTPLVVQWLRLQAPNVGGPVLSLIRELDPTYCNLNVLNATTET